MTLKKRTRDLTKWFRGQNEIAGPKRRLILAQKIRYGRKAVGGKNLRRAILD